MGSATQNFYNAAFSRQGFADDVQAVQRLWLAGKREEAAARVPRDIGFKTNLIGPPGLRAASAATARPVSPLCRSSPPATAMPRSTRSPR